MILNLYHEIMIWKFNKGAWGTMRINWYVILWQQLQRIKLLGCTANQKEINLTVCFGHTRTHDGFWQNVSLSPFDIMAEIPTVVIKYFLGDHLCLAGTLTQKPV